jgi:hypothetical protein
MTLSVRLALASAIVPFLALTLTQTPNAQTGLVFQTTFNCPEWNQSMGLNDSVVCNAGDRISGWGGWSTSSGMKDQITSTANNPSGAGGRGFRHWRGDGQNNNGGGLVIQLPAPVQEVWVRYYMRYQAGFAWTNGAPQYTKEHYWNVGQRAQFQFGFSSGSVYLHTYEGSTPNMTSSKTWSSVNGGTTGDGRFHCYEYHVKMDTNGTNGIAEIWYEGTKVMTRTNANWSNGGGATWSEFVLGDNQYNPSNGASMYTDYDDIAVSTTGYIGPLGGGTPTPPVPAAPSDLRIIR